MDTENRKVIIPMSEMPATLGGIPAWIIRADPIIIDAVIIEKARRLTI